MKEAKDFAELTRHYHAIKSGVSGDTLWSAEALLFMAKRIDGLKKVEKLKFVSPLNPPVRRIGFAIGKVFVGLVLEGGLK